MLPSAEPVRNPLKAGRVIHTRLRPHSSHGAAVFSTLHQPYGARDGGGIRVARKAAKRRMARLADDVWEASAASEPSLATAPIDAGGGSVGAASTAGVGVARAMTMLPSMLASRGLGPARVGG